MESELTSEALQVILQSHGLPYGADSPLSGDRFDDFLNWRQQRLTRELAQVTGWPLIDG